MPIPPATSGAQVHEREIGRRLFRPAVLVHDADRHAGRPHQAAEIAAEVIVAADEERGQLRHGLLHETNDHRKGTASEPGCQSRQPDTGVMRP